MQDLQAQQVRGEEFEQVKGNKDPDYSLDKHEEHLVHAQLEIPRFNVHTGKQESTPYVQKFGVREFQEMSKNNGFSGYKVTVLHDPTKGGSLAGIKNVTAGGQSLGDRNHPDTFAALLKGEKVETKDVAEAEKKIDKMNKEDLTKVYIDLYKEEPPKSADGKDLTKADLVERIKEKLAFLQEDAK